MDRHEEKRTGIKVLHLDDEPNFLALTKTFLERETEDFTVDSATSAEDGIALLKSGDYEVVIADYQMPGMDGLQFLQHLREEGNTISFIMLTGSGREEVAIEALNEGANYYLQKGADVESMYRTLMHAIHEIVAKQSAEDRLVEVERARKIILDSVPVGLFFLNTTGKFVFVNEFLAQLYGKKPEDFIGRSTEELFPEEAARYLKSDREVVQSGRSRVGVIGEIHTASGKRWIRLDKVPVKDAAGNVTGIIGFELDITELKQAEYELNHLNRVLRAIVENTSDMIYFATLDGTLTFVSTQVSTYGYAPEEVVGYNIFEYIHPDDVERVSADLQRCLEVGEEAPIEFRIVQRDGSVVYVEESDTFIREGDGIVGLIGTIRDITDRKAVEEDLRKSEEEYRSLVESTEDSVYLVDRDCRYLFMNEKHLSRFGMPKDQIIGKTYGEFHSEEKTKEFGELVDGVFETDKSVQHEHRSHRDNRYFLRTLSPVKDSEGRTMAVTVISKEITERKRAEEDRERLLGELEAKNRELEAKNRELERFTYTVSHDLRSPLITIQGFTDMLRKDLEEKEREKVENDLQHITKATTQMSRLLHDTLELSRIGRMVNPPEDVSFGKIVDDALGQTAGELTANHVRVSVAKEFPTVHVDRMRIVEALVNLIANCIKYMGDQPSPEIDIGYRVEGAEMVFFVKDNGIGIDPSWHEKVFELFWKVDGRSEGTGAGLAIVKRIIEVHRGRIWMESEKGKGCTVCFTLPVVSG